jgi:hypothetical protein
MISCESDTRTFLYFGWSMDASPLPLPTRQDHGNWCRFHFSNGSLLYDYPKIGHSDRFFLIGSNVFDLGHENEFVTASIIIVVKPKNGKCDVPASFEAGSQQFPLLRADGQPAFTPVPASLIDGGPNAYVVAADATGDILDEGDAVAAAAANHINVWHIAGPKDGPFLFDDGGVEVKGYDVPANAPQPGTKNLIDTLDARLTQAIGAKDPDADNLTAIWTQHTTDGRGGRSVVRWYEIIPSKCGVGVVCPADALRQQGTISSGQHFIFNGAVSPTLAGNSAGIQFNLSSATRFAEIHAQTRIGTDPLGTMGGDKLIGTSDAFDQDFSCGPTVLNPNPCRWGDYSALNPDPNDTSTLWGTNMRLGPPDGRVAHWTTHNFSLKP